MEPTPNQIIRSSFGRRSAERAKPTAAAVYASIVASWIPKAAPWWNMSGQEAARDACARVGAGGSDAFTAQTPSAISPTAAPAARVATVAARESRDSRRGGTTAAAANRKAPTTRAQTPA